MRPLTIKPSNTCEKKSDSLQSPLLQRSRKGQEDTKEQRKIFMGEQRVVSPLIDQRVEQTMSKTGAPSFQASTAPCQGPSRRVSR